MSAAEIDMMDLATRASEALAAEVARSGWGLVREKIARFLRRDEPAVVERQLAELDVAGERCGPNGDGDPEALRAQCFWQLGMYLQRNPDAVEELEQLLTDLGVGGRAAGAVMNANGNTNSVVIQAGGNVSTGKGSITASTRPRR
ncbi:MULTISPECIES: hypothetical protein [Streptomycetaceae]|uniref:hypothetical protein n=1 Tax=Streptomycetaceae TaxID=2062 RepID=UPI000670A115|nr:MULTISPECIES: hypothetical protein [Streptomycetaceae]OKI00486.1 hypothetical protein AMK13_32850 [Streptomyces sp. CB02056]